MTYCQDKEQHDRSTEDLRADLQRMTVLAEKRQDTVDLLTGQLQQAREHLSKADLQIEENETADAYDHQKMDEFAREFFPDEEGKTWAAGFSLGKLLEMVRERFALKRNHEGGCTCPPECLQGECRCGCKAKSK